LPLQNKNKRKKKKSDKQETGKAIMDGLLHWEAALNAHMVYRVMVEKGVDARLAP
jgi:hypothetical protein